MKNIRGIPAFCLDQQTGCAIYSRFSHVAASSSNELASSRKVIDRRTLSLFILQFLRWLGIVHGLVGYSVVDTDADETGNCYQQHLKYQCCTLVETLCIFGHVAYAPLLVE